MQPPTSLSCFKVADHAMLRDLVVAWSLVNDEDNLAFTVPINAREIEEAVYQIPPLRAPGPDGFSGCFYHDHWATVGTDVVQIIKAFWHFGKLLRKLNHTNLLIPKVKCPRTMS